MTFSAVRALPARLPLRSANKDSPRCITITTGFMLPCAICGGLVRPCERAGGGEWGGDLQWQTKATLLRDPASEFETLEMHYRGGKKKNVEKLQEVFNADIRLDHAAVTDSDICVLADSGEEITPYWLADFDEHGMPYSILYTIVAHQDCFDIAIRVMRTPQLDLHVRGLRALWKVLRSRFDARDSELMESDGTGPHYVIMEHGHYIPRGYITAYSSLEDGHDAGWVGHRVPDLGWPVFLTATRTWRTQFRYRS